MSVLCCVVFYKYFLTHVLIPISYFLLLYYSFTFFLILGAALLLPASVATIVAYRYIKSKKSSLASADGDAEAGKVHKSETLSIDIGEQGVDASGHSVNGETSGRTGGSFSSLIATPAVLLSSARTRFSALQQNSPMRTPVPPTKNPMTRPDVAI
jgi:hypothetical protein